MAGSDAWLTGMRFPFKSVGSIVGDPVFVLVRSRLVLRS